MQPTRSSQPYRQGGLRPPGPALQAMLRGKPHHLPNPSAARNATLAQLMKGSRRMRSRRVGLYR